MNVPTGGRKKKLSVSIARSETTIAVLSRASVAAPSTTSSSASAAVVGLTSGSARSAAVTAAIAPRLPRKTTISRAVRRRTSARSDSATSVATAIGSAGQLLMDSLRLSYATRMYGGVQDGHAHGHVVPCLVVEPEELSVIMADYLALERARIYRRLFVTRFGLLALVAGRRSDSAFTGCRPSASWVSVGLCAIAPAWAWVARVAMRLATGQAAASC